MECQAKAWSIRSMVATVWMTVAAAASLPGPAWAAGDAPAETPAAAPPDPLAAAIAADPDDPVLRFFQGLQRARSSDFDGALAAFEASLARGDGLLPPAGLVRQLAGDPRFPALQQRFVARLPQVNGARPAFTFRDRELIPEGIAYDPVTKAFYVGSVNRKAVYRVTSGGLQRFSQAADGLDPILGLTVDARRRRLLVVSTNGFLTEAEASRRNQLVIYDLRSRRKLAAHPLPDARQANDVAVLPNGDAIVTDTAGHAVWRIAYPSGAVSAVVAPGKARGANGLAISDDGREVFVALSRGVARVDLESGEVRRLPLPPRENSAAIDGLYWYRGNLIGVQNVTNPGRVVHLVLNADRSRIERVETLLSHHHPSLDEPTTAATAPDGLYLLATTQVTHYGDDGRIKDPAVLVAPQVLRVRLPR